MTCTCVAGSVGAILQAAFDSDRNCNISLPELTGNAALNQLLSVDLTVEGRPMISFGMSFTAVRASF